MISCGIWCRVGLIRSENSEERVASILRMEIISTSSQCASVANVFSRSSVLVTLMMAAISSSENSVLTRATWR
jgi:hypothetical protein